MDVNELGNILNKMYFESDKGETVSKIHLFGVKYAKQIIKSGASKKAIAIAAKIPESYGSEISKGVKLAKYVSPK